MATHMSYCQYPDCKYLATTQVALRNAPKQGGWPLGDWIAVCKKHRYTIERIRIEVWRNIKWQPRHRIDAHTGKMLANYSDYQGETIGEQKVEQLRKQMAERNI